MAENSNNTKNKNPKRRSVSEKSKFSSKKQRESSASPKNAKSKKAKSKKNTKSRLNLFLSLIFLAACVSLAVIVLPKDEKKTKTVIAKNIEEKNIENPKEQSQKNIKKDLNPVQNQKNTENPIKSSPKEKPPATSKEKSNPPKEKTANPKEKPISPSNSKEKKTETLKTIPPAKNISEDSPKIEKQIPAFKIPSAKNKATIVLVVDDAGLNVENTKKYASLPFPLTIAVLPKLSHSKECAQVVHDFGKELILHQPMQSLNKNLDPGPGKITVDMSFSQIESVINENLRELGPFVKGMNNHEGSQVTEDVIRIGAVIDVCQQNGIYFLDSRTTPNTKAPQAALERDIKIFEKSGPYIDNVVDRNAMLEKLYEAFDIANKNGKTIIIAHVDKSANVLPQLLLEMYPHIVKAGYSFATPSMLEK
ncbi:divergent polysaccharide deacetylase family protein [Treponema pectinovorum]|uniref:divergent polysaccharide deacetylase family protein n=1 Tax=Treponema pectinovorum TaxID=164 RepID=UPI0011CC51BB|nr:divergent polysaccharide deacetylase family protein [Treponema pectinovorum]